MVELEISKPGLLSSQKIVSFSFRFQDNPLLSTENPMVQDGEPLPTDNVMPKGGPKHPVAQDDR